MAFPSIKQSFQQARNKPIFFIFSDLDDVKEPSEEDLVAGIRDLEESLSKDVDPGVRIEEVLAAIKKYKEANPDVSSEEIAALISKAKSGSSLDEIKKMAYQFRAGK